MVQGEALALALFSFATRRAKVAVTADCRPAILQAGGTSFRAVHTNVWEDVWEERHRLLITWHPSHRSPREYEERYGVPRHWRVQLNELADKACKDAAAEIPWRQHAAAVEQLDEVVEEVAHFLAGRAWTMLAGAEAPPLDLKPRNKPRSNLPPKPKGRRCRSRSHPSLNIGPRREGAPIRSSGWRHTSPLSTFTAIVLSGRTPTPPITPSSARPAPFSSSRYTLQRPLAGSRRSRAHIGRCPTLADFSSTSRAPSTTWVQSCCVPKCFAVHKPGQLTLTKGRENAL